MPQAPLVLAWNRLYRDVKVLYTQDESRAPDTVGHWRELLRKKSGSTINREGWRGLVGTALDGTSG